MTDVSLIENLWRQSDELVGTWTTNNIQICNLEMALIFLIAFSNTLHVWLYLGICMYSCVDNNVCVYISIEESYKVTFKYLEQKQWCRRMESRSHDNICDRYRSLTQRSLLQFPSSVIWSQSLVYGISRGVMEK